MYTINAKEMRGSFVIVNYNRKEEILLTVAKTKNVIEETPGNFEIIVVDNASTDGSAAALKEIFPDVILIENKVNIGAPAWNLGFERAKGLSMIILDDDSHIETGLDDALAYFEQHEDTGVLALNVSGGLHQTAHWLDKDEMDGFIGCGAIVKKDLYNKIGGYADWIFLYTNEWEFSIRCLEAGYKIIYYESCKVIHRTSSINRTNKRLIVYSARNEMAIVYKYFAAGTRNFYVLRVLLNNIKGIKKYGLIAISWYYTAFIEFLKLRKMLLHTPVSDKVQDFYKEKFWPVRPVF